MGFLTHNNSVRRYEPWNSALATRQRKVLTNIHYQYWLARKRGKMKRKPLVVLTIFFLAAVTMRQVFGHYSYCKPYVGNKSSTNTGVPFVQGDYVMNGLNVDKVMSENCGSAKAPDDDPAKAVCTGSCNWYGWAYGDDGCTRDNECTHGCTPSVYDAQKGTPPPITQSQVYSASAGCGDFSTTCGCNLPGGASWVAVPNTKYSVQHCVDITETCFG